MMNSWNKLFLHSTLMAIILCMLVPAAFAAEGGWKLASKKDGIDVSTRSVAGSDFDDFMGTGVILRRCYCCRAG